MFTIEQIDALHARLGRAESLADYLRELAAIGVAPFDSHVSDGHSEFFGSDGRRVVSPAHHDVLDVASQSDREALAEAPPTAPGRRNVVPADVPWGCCERRGHVVTDTNALTMTYRDSTGEALFIEHIDPADPRMRQRYLVMSSRAVDRHIRHET